MAGCRIFQIVLTPRHERILFAYEIVTPQNPDVHALPEFSFSFFNPDDEKYHTLTQPPLQLVVRSAGATPVPMIAANKNSANEN